jgi:hypothetical protein
MSTIPSQRRPILIDEISFDNLPVIIVEWDGSKLYLVCMIQHAAPVCLSIHVQIPWSCINSIMMDAAQQSHQRLISDDRDHSSSTRCLYRRNPNQLTRSMEATLLLEHNKPPIRWMCFSLLLLMKPSDDRQWEWSAGRVTLSRLMFVFKLFNFSI